MTYSIEHLEHHMHLVTDEGHGRLFEGTLLHCEQYVKALNYIVPLEAIEVIPPMQIVVDSRAVRDKNTQHH
jgi:hypothetical protein